MESQWDEIHFMITYDHTTGSIELELTSIKFIETEMALRI